MKETYVVNITEVLTNDMLYSVEIVTIEELNKYIIKNYQSIAKEYGLIHLIYCYSLKSNNELFNELFPTIKTESIITNIMFLKDTLNYITQKHQNVSFSLTFFKTLI